MNETKTEQKCVTGVYSKNPGVTFDERLNKLFAEGWRIVPGTIAVTTVRDGPQDLALFCAVVERPVPAPK